MALNSHLLPTHLLFLPQLLYPVGFFFISWLLSRNFTLDELRKKKQALVSVPPAPCPALSHPPCLGAGSANQLLGDSKQLPKPPASDLCLQAPFPPCTETSVVYTVSSRLARATQRHSNPTVTTVTTDIPKEVSLCGFHWLSHCPETVSFSCPGHR